MMTTKLKCICLVLYSPDGVGLDSDGLWVDKEQLDPEQIQRSEPPKAPYLLKDLDGNEPHLSLVKAGHDAYAGTREEFEFNIAIKPDCCVYDAVMHVLCNPYLYDIPPSARFVGWGTRPTSGHITYVDLQ